MLFSTSQRPSFIYLLYQLWRTSSSVLIGLTVEFLYWYLLELVLKSNKNINKINKLIIELCRVPENMEREMMIANNNGYYDLQFPISCKSVVHFTWNKQMTLLF